MATILHITQDNFEQEVEKAPIPVLLDYWADWCGPCRMLSPTIEELAQEFCGKIRVAKINIDEEPTVALLHKVMSIPTVCLYVNGKEVKRLVGLRDKAELTEVIKTVLK